MMILILFRILFSLVFFFGDSTHSQTSPRQVRTSDMLYRDGTLYYIDRSPLGYFTGYDTLFSDFEERARKAHVVFGFSLVDNPEEYYSLLYPLYRDKGYSILWKMAGDSLYVNEIYFYKSDQSRSDSELIYPRNEQYRALERFTGEKFSETAPAAGVEPKAPHGVMPAVWVSGDYLIKASYTFDKKWETPTLRLTFDKGKLVGVKKSNVSLIPNTIRHKNES